jgi:hypothetical protein
MRDEDHRDPARLEVAHDLEQMLGLVGVEARRRFVEHERTRIVLERAGDRDQLLDRHGIGAERPLDVDVDAEPLEALPCQFARRAPRNQAEPTRLATQRQILRNRHGRDEIDFLIDRADAERAGFARAADLDLAAIETDHALVARERAGHDLDQRRLARAILAHERMDFAGLDAEIDAVQRPNAGEGLRHARHLYSCSGGFAQPRPLRLDKCSGGAGVDSPLPTMLAPPCSKQKPGGASPLR